MEEKQLKNYSKDIWKRIIQFKKVPALSQTLDKSLALVIEIIFFVLYNSGV